MLQDLYCNIICQVDLKSKDVADFKHAIKSQYHHNWIVDNLPAASILDTDQFTTTQFVGFPVGYQDGDMKNYYVYNHVNILLDYHTVEENGHRIVGFYVEPMSVKHTFASGKYSNMHVHHYCNIAVYVLLCLILKTWIPYKAQSAHPPYHSHP